MELKPYLRSPHFYETDAMGVVHHANYVHWMEEARVFFMDQIGFGYDKAVEAGIDFALTQVNCRYKSMTRFGETVAIHVSISKLTPARMEVSYKMLDRENGALRCEGETGHFFYDRNKSRPVALKRALPELYAIFEGLSKEQVCRTEK